MLNFPQPTSGSGQYCLFQFNRGTWTGRVLTEAYSIEHVPNYSEKIDLLPAMQDENNFISHLSPCLPRTRKEAGYSKEDPSDCVIHPRSKHFQHILKHENHTLAKVIEKTILTEMTQSIGESWLTELQTKFQRPFYIQSETIRIPK